MGRWVFFVALGALAFSGVVLALDQQWGDAARLVGMAIVLLLVSRAEVPTLFLGLCAVSLLIATWAAVWRWYPAVPFLDEAVHVVAPGSLAAVAYFLLARVRLLPDVREPGGSYRAGAPLLWVGMIGTTTAVLWEYYEWVVEHVSPQGMIVGYTDTVSDLLAGMIGAVVAGFLVLWWAGHAERGPGVATAAPYPGAGAASEGGRDGSQSRGDGTEDG